MALTTQLARAMFIRRCLLDMADDAMAELAWTDPGVRSFWEAEAAHVLDFLTGLDVLSVPDEAA